LTVSYAVVNDNGIVMYNISRFLKSRLAFKQFNGTQQSNTVPWSPLVAQSMIAMHQEPFPKETILLKIELLVID
jgi:hypothetical protein